jgi:hypothetical protein
LFQDDWIMRQINDMVRFITVIMTKKETTEFDQVEEQKNASGRNDLRDKLTLMIDEKKIKEAEELLLDSLDIKDRQYLNLSIDFYAKLNRLDNEALEQGGFSREAVQKGLSGVAARFGIPVAALFLDLPM